MSHVQQLEVVFCTETEQEGVLLAVCSGNNALICYDAHVLCSGASEGANEVFRQRHDSSVSKTKKQSLLICKSELH